MGENGGDKTNLEQDLFVLERQNVSFRKGRAEGDEKGEEKDEEEVHDKMDSLVLEQKDALRVTNDEKNATVGGTCVDPERSPEDSADDKQSEESSLDGQDRQDIDTFSENFPTLCIRASSCKRFSEQEIAQALSSEISPDSSQHRKRLINNDNNHEENLVSNDVQKDSDDKIDATFGENHVDSGIEKSVQ